MVFLKYENLFIAVTVVSGGADLCEWKPSAFLLQKFQHYYHKKYICVALLVRDSEISLERVQTIVQILLKGKDYFEKNKNPDNFLTFSQCPICQALDIVVYFNATWTVKDIYRGGECTYMKQFCDDCVPEGEDAQWKDEIDHPPPK